MKDKLRMKRNWRGELMVLLALSAGSAYLVLPHFAAPPSVDQTVASPPENMQIAPGSQTASAGEADSKDTNKVSVSSVKLGDYRLTEKLVNNQVISFALSLNGKSVLEQSVDAIDANGIGQYFTFIDPDHDPQADQGSGSGVPAAPVAKDINGDGVPDLIVLQYSGGAHCCTTCSIISLGKDGPKQIFKTDLKDAQVEFVDLDHNGKYEIKTGDDNYAYWNTYFADSPIPDIVLAWDGKTYALALERMRKLPVTSAQIDDMTVALRSQLEADGVEGNARAQAIKPYVWTKMLDLVYSGNAAAALVLLNRLYRETTVLELEKDFDGGNHPVPMHPSDFWKLLAGQIKHSPYLPALKKLNPGVFD